MCEYCEQGKAICKQNRTELGIEFSSGECKLMAYGLDRNNWDISVNCNINFCPMCGKRINLNNK